MRSIRVCGNVKGIIRGCKTGGRIYIVYPIRALETTLVHEYGHLNGLSHPPKRAEYAWRIMYFRYDPNRAGVTTFECTALTGDILEKYQEQKAFADIEAAEIIPDIAETEAEEILNPIVEDINEFLSEVWLHGTPVAQILTLDESQLSVVRKVVSQISDLDKLSNAITVLGIRGERSDVPALKDALFTLAGVNSPAGQEALLTVPIALGMIAGRTRSPEAMEVLENWVMSMGLQQLTINSGVSEQTLRENFIVGLAYTGTLSRSGSLSDIETAAERGLFEMQFDEGFSEYVRTLEGTILEKGVVESLR